MYRVYQAVYPAHQEHQHSDTHCHSPALQAPLNWPVVSDMIDLVPGMMDVMVHPVTHHSPPAPPSPPLPSITSETDAARIPSCTLTEASTRKIREVSSSFVVSPPPTLTPLNKEGLAQNAEEASEEPSPAHRGSHADTHSHTADTNSHTATANTQTHSARTHTHTHTCAGTAHTVDTFAAAHTHSTCSPVHALYSSTNGEAERGSGGGGGEEGGERGIVSELEGTFQMFGREVDRQCDEMLFFLSPSRESPHTQSARAREGERSECVARATETGEETREQTRDAPSAAHRGAADMRLSFL